MDKLEIQLLICPKMYYNINMIEREISDNIMQYAKQYPVITITGPRQSGKTTLCKYLFKQKPYVSLENLDERSFAIQDPRGFLNRFPNGAILDEIQRTPELLSYIQQIVDDKNKEGMFIITGSHQFELLNSINQTLAGRTALVKLLPFSMKEIKPIIKDKNIDEIIFTGFYPRIYDKKLNPAQALAFYVNTYIERDVREIENIKNLSIFEMFLKLCAGRTGQIINYSSLGNDCGVSYHTIKNWLSVLEASYIIKLLKPYYKNFNKRLIKSPKLYFIDTGLCCNLLGISKKEHVEYHPLKGAFFENLVISEILKNRYNQGNMDNLYYYRDKQGNEVDLILDYGYTVEQFEIKSGQTINNDYFKGINYFKKINKDMRKSHIIYGGDETYTRSEVAITGWKKLFDLSIE